MGESLPKTAAFTRPQVGLRQNYAQSYYRARYYDPATGRFLSQDPIEFNSGQGNFYDYVSNSPLGNSDPSGLAKCWYIISFWSDGNGWLRCVPDDPRHSEVSIKAASGNNGDSKHSCKNNRDCTNRPGQGPIPLGDWYWGGVSQSKKDKGGRHLYPVPGTGTNDKEQRSGILTHWCANPFSNRPPAPGHHYCSEGCITATQDDIDNLNKLLDAEPGSTLQVVALPEY
jgi:RHS repeat-associated protein